VNDYDVTKSKIEKFIGGIEKNHVHIKKCFDPDVSVKNMEIFNSFLDADELDMIKELELLYEDLVTKATSFM